MEQVQPFTQKQREMFARMLEDARKREEAELESESDVDDRTKAEVLPKLAKEHGAIDLIAKVRKLRREAEETEEALDKLGFSCDEDSISLKWNAPKVLQRALSEAKHAARKERDAVLKKYDRAILAVWAGENAQDARTIVEELL